jgi:hypothetical protein
LLAVAGDRLKLLVGESAAVRFRVAGAAPAFVPITQTTVNYSVVVTTPMQGGICTEEAGCPRGEVRVLSSAAGTVKTDGNGVVNISPVLDPTWGAVHVLIHARTASGAERIAEFDMVQPAP